MPTGTPRSWSFLMFSIARPGSWAMIVSLTHDLEAFRAEAPGAQHFAEPLGEGCGEEMARARRAS